jgi:hypothetical protein
MLLSTAIIPPSLITDIKNLVPGSSRQMRLQAYAFKNGFSEPKTLAFAAMPLGNNFMKSFLDKGFKGRLLLAGDFARFFAENSSRLFLLFF